MANLTNNNKNWKDWTNLVLFTIVMSLATGSIMLYLRYSDQIRTMQYEQLRCDIAKVEILAKETEVRQTRIVADLITVVNKLNIQVDQNTRDLMLNYKSRMELYNKTKSHRVFQSPPQSIE